MCACESTQMCVSGFKRTIITHSISFSIYFCTVLSIDQISMKFRKKTISGAVNSLLESVGDKDDGVKGAVERSLVRMCKRRPNETIEIICAYRAKCPKLPEPQISILLR